MAIQAVAFYIFAFMTVGSGVMVVTRRNPVHSVLFLILAFFNAAGLMILVGAEFVAMLLVIVYVGAVAVLFLFVVMMLDINYEMTRRGLVDYLPVGVGIGMVLVGEVVFAFSAWDQLHVPVGRTDLPIPLPVVVTGPAEIADVAVIPAVAEQVVSNTHMIGRHLYTTYILAFQGAGLILLVAMIGAIVLTLRHRVGVRRQSVSRQFARRPADVLAVRQVASGVGLPQTALTGGDAVQSASRPVIPADDSHDDTTPALTGTRAGAL